jgi:ABC-2 type transport system permease protein
MTAAAPPVGSGATVLAHYRYLLLEQVRIPIAVVSAAAFPALSLLLFVVPFGWSADPAAATTAVAQLCVFGVLTGYLFTFGIGVADDREKPWDPYLRTLPAPATARIAGRLLVGVSFGVIAIIPVLLVGAVFTSASVPAGTLLLGVLAVLVAGVPFLFAGLVIGYSLPTKAAVPATQLAFLPVAFGGGLLVPPDLFPDRLQTVSSLLPSRGARDLVVWTVSGAPPSTLAVVMFGVWTVVLGGLAVRAYRRDEGRRYR